MFPSYIVYHFLKNSGHYFLFNIRFIVLNNLSRIICLTSMDNFFFFFFFFCLFRAIPMAYGGSQARGRIEAIMASLHHSHSNAKYLTQWMRPGIKPANSWLLVRFISAEPWGEIQWKISNTVPTHYIYPEPPKMLSWKQLLNFWFF